jgi:hypothetical protein
MPALDRIAKVQPNEQRDLVAVTLDRYFAVQVLGLEESSGASSA